MSAHPILELVKARWRSIAIIGALLGLGGAAAVTYPRWWPSIQQLLGQQTVAAEDSQHGHDHGSQSSENTLVLSEVGWKNVGLRTAVVQAQTYVKTVSIPAIVVERPGRSQVEIAAPLTGIVTRVHPMEAEAVEPGQRLFDLRLTHEDLVTAQRDFLQSAQELDVVKREIARLESVGEGVIAGRRVLEHKYEQQKLEAALHAQRQGLLLHGLNDEQIDGILDSRRLLPSLTVTAPEFDGDAGHHDVQHLYHVQKVLVKRGQSVAAGEALAVLADHCLLYVEGQAFEDDARRLIEAAREGQLLNVSAVATGPAESDRWALELLYVADQVDRDSRALRFYLRLPNELLRSRSKSDRRFVHWRFRPGQRMEIRSRLGQSWTNQIVLPPEAVVDEGAEAFVFEQNGDLFQRIPVHVLHRDKDAVVVENDGRLLGATLAMSGAYQMHLALKNQSGGGVDAHAGHSH